MGWRGEPIVSQEFRSARVQTGLGRNVCGNRADCRARQRAGREYEAINAGPAAGIVLAWDGGGSAGTRGQSVTIQQLVTFANRMADGCRRTGRRAVSLTDGVRMAGRVSLLTGSRFLGARSLIIPFRTGAARRRVG